MEFFEAADPETLARAHASAPDPVLDPGRIYTEVELRLNAIAHDRRRRQALARLSVRVASPNTIADEFGLVFISGTGATREVRVTRYSPVGARSRERSLLELSDADLRQLFGTSQPSDTSPEADYSA